MAIYITSFLISCGLIFVAEKIKASKPIKAILIIAALLIVCLVAGLRYESVGTDITVYLKPLYTAARKSRSLKSFFSHEWYYEYTLYVVSDFEYGFTLLVYVLTKLFHNFQVVLFAIHAIILTGIYTGFHKLKKIYNIQIWLGMFMFYFIYFNMSLNVMRQWIAMAIVFSALVYLLKKKKRYFFYVIIATFFHKSAILFGTALFIINLLVSFGVNKKSRSNNNLPLKTNRNTLVIYRYEIRIILIVLLALIVVLYALPIIGNILVGLGFSYGYYFTGDVEFSINQIIMRLPYVCVIIVSYKSTRNKKHIGFFILLVLIDLILSQSATVQSQSYRMYLWFGYMAIAGMPVICSMVSKDKRFLINLLLIAYAVVYWVYYYAILNTHYTLPYVWC